MSGHGIFIAGFPYVRERYFAVWKYYSEPDALKFLLPKRWTAKNGAVVFVPPNDARVTTTRAYFHHSHAPGIGGLLKGWMPAFPVHLWRERHAIGLVYSCSEPILLTTLCQALWSRLMGKRHVCFSWENIPYEKKFSGLSRLVHMLILRLNIFLSDGLICGNKAGSDIHRCYTYKPIAVIPMNGLDPDMFQRVPNEHLSHLSNKIVYSFVGAIEYHKGILVLLRAFKELLTELPNAHLIIAGSGSYEKEIDARINDFRLREHITRFPWVDHHELVRLLSASDIFVYPSIPHGGWTEQFGYSMAEASLMELPVISTRTGSIADVILDNQTGILVPPNDVDALMTAMLHLGRDGTLRKQLGLAGRRYVSSNFSHPVVAQRFFEFFQRILT